MTIHSHKQLPWCAIFLVVASVTCYALVLYGNLQFSTAVKKLADSTIGWADVAIGVANSLQEELEKSILSLVDELNQSIVSLLGVQELLDLVLSIMGNITDAAAANQSTGAHNLEESASAEMAFLHMNSSSATKAAAASASVAKALLQVSQAPGGGISPLIMQTIHTLLEVIMAKLIEAVNTLLDRLVPALKKVGEWLITFGQQMISKLEGFFVTLDMVQKIFDKIMGIISGGARAEVVESMQFETFHLFDVGGDGLVGVEDLQSLSRIYSITVLQSGVKDTELVSKYDADGDGYLNQNEFSLFSDESEFPGLMTGILRSYAKALEQVSGNVAAARNRDDLSAAVVDYFQLVCLKNRTKVAWVSNALSNGSLPLQFTADILAQLCLAADDPDLRTTADVGDVIVQEMLSLNRTHILAAVDLMANVTFWTEEGFDPEDLPPCMRMVAGWVERTNPVMMQAMLERLDARYSGSLTAARRREGGVVDDVPRTVGAVSMELVSSYMYSARKAQAARYAQLYSSSSSKMLLVKLMSGEPASWGPRPSEAELAINGGQPALPETLRFAQWLSWNASGTSLRLQKLCFEYSGTSSNVADSFATQFNGMMKQLSSFVSMMQRFATPTRIQSLRDQMQSFVDNAAGDILNLMEDKVDSVLQSAIPTLEDAIGRWIREGGQTFGEEIGHTVGSLIGALMAPVANVLGNVFGDPDVANAIADDRNQALRATLANVSADTLGNILADALRKLITETLYNASALFRPSMPTPRQLPLGRARAHGQVRVDARAELMPDSPEDNGMQLIQVSAVRVHLAAHQVGCARPDGCSHRMEGSPHAVFMQHGGVSRSDNLTSVWDHMATLLKSLTNVLPESVKSLRYARKEVSKLSPQLADVFRLLKQKGPPIFDHFANMWNVIWVLFLFCFVPANLILLLYAFWCNGYLGGPGKPLLDEHEGAPPNTIGQRVGTLLLACGHCCHDLHDWQLCFWSFLMAVQVVILLIFLIALVLCLLSGIELFMGMGCVQIYIIEDSAVCTQALQTLRDALRTFQIGDTFDPLLGACEENKLLACRLITRELKHAALFTSVFSLLGAVFSYELLLDSARFHERAVWRRRIASLEMVAPRSGLPVGGGPTPTGLLHGTDKGT